MPNMMVQDFSHFNPMFKDLYISTMTTLPDSTIAFGTYYGNVILYNEQYKQALVVEPIKAIQGFTVKKMVFTNNKLYVARGNLTIYDYAKNTAKVVEKVNNLRDFIISGDTLFYVHPEHAGYLLKHEIDTGKEPTFTPLLRKGGRKVMQHPATKEIYFALNDGLYVWRKNALKPVLYKNEPIFAFDLKADEKHLYVATQNQSVLRIGKNGTEQLFKEVLQFEDKSLKSILLYNNHLWLCTNSDVARGDLTTNKLSIFSKQIGINPKEINCLEQLGKWIFAGTKKTVLRFPYTLDGINTDLPQVHLEYITVDNALINNNNLNLPYDFTNLKFNFKAFAYRSGNALVYEYRLKGHNDQWSRTNASSPYAIFSALPAGEYQFEVRAMNDCGLLGNTLRVKLTVNHPFWQTWWFYALEALVLVLVIAFVVKIQSARIKRKNEAEKKLIHSQLTALKAQMNPHFMYNALNSIQALMLQQDTKKSNYYLSRFSNLMRKVLDASDKEYISLEEEKNMLELYLSLEQMRFGDGLTYNINIDEKIDPHEMALPPMIIQPFVENAIKHGLLHKKGEKRLEIGFELGDTLICTITDNGIGRKQSQTMKERLREKHTSFSTQAMEKRVELLNNYTKQPSTITITDLEDNGQALGTKVTISIPLKKIMA